MKVRETIRFDIRTKPRRAAACLLAAMLACAPALPAGDALRQKPKTPPPIKFGVISDLHVYETLLGASGTAFERYLAQDPKLLRESGAILDAAIAGLIQEKVKFVIVPGDLTKDGELASHLLVAQKLRKLEQHGIQVFVVPGNHDINNPDAVSFAGDLTQPTPGVTPQLFLKLYHRFGYGQAIDRAPDSLSYIAQPAPDVWLLALDSCKYAESATSEHPVVGGRLSPATMTWALSKLQQAQKRGKQVIAFVHHGVNQHFLGEAQIFPDYLVDDWPTVSARLAAAGLKVIFTGHYHSQDAAWPMDANLVPQYTLCDVETGSLVSYPCAYRLVTLDRPGTVSAGQMQIESRRVTEIAADTGGLPFQTYAEEFQRARLPLLVTYQLMGMFKLPQDQAASVAPLVVDGLMANYAGDEQPSQQTQAMISGLVQSPEPQHTLGLMLSGLWTDPLPGDNALVLTIDGSQHGTAARLEESGEASFGGGN